MVSHKYSLNLMSFKSIVVQEVRRFFRIWVQTLVPPVITISLYFVIFGKLIGSQISNINGFTYMQFMVPGLIMLSVITNSYTNVVSSFYSKRFQKSIEELLVSPTSNIVILLGYCSGGICRALITGSIVFVISIFYAQTTVLHPFLMLIVVFLTASLFSLIGLINAVFARNFDDVSIVPTFVLTPLTYLGGVFYSVSLLPPFWEAVSRLNPILYIINALRFSMLGISDVNVYVSISILIIFNLLIGSVGYLLLEKGIGLKQ